MRRARILQLALLVLCPLATMQAQRDPSYDNLVVPQTRIDARDLGYRPVDVIPDGESGITSLCVAPNGNVFGATSGTKSHLFVVNAQHGYVVPLGVIPGAQAVTQALVVAANGHVFLGTSPSGHLLEYVPKDLDNQPIEISKPLTVIDHGAAIAGEAVRALVIDPQRNAIYGLTMPNAHFFRYSIADGKFADLGVVAKDAPWAEKTEHDKMLSRMLVVDANGNVFASGENGVLYRYAAASDVLEKLAIHAPAVPGRERYTEVDAFVATSAGAIYGATSDGYLFRLDPDKLTITNLGKALSQYHVAGLAEGHDGKLYGVGGDTTEMARLFSFDPSTGAYEVTGFIDVNRRPYYTWQAEVVGAVVADARGTVYIGENERISKLYLYFP